MRTTEYALGIAVDEVLCIEENVHQQRFFKTLYLV